MPDIALITPTSLESKDLRCTMRPSPDEKQGVLSRCFLHGNPVIFSHCGIGKVNAAHSTTILLENNKIDYLILFGIGGAYSDYLDYSGYLGARVGDVAVAESENYGEEGVFTGEGWKPMEFTGLPLLKNKIEYFNSFPVDGKLSQLAAEASKDMGLNTHVGPFITVSQCSGTRIISELLQKRFNGLCENMEGAAVAHICAMYDVPMIEIRGISNLTGDRDMKKWNIPLAASNCNKAVGELVRRLS